jgi:hypothetical protein
LGIESSVEVEGDVVMGECAACHGEYFTIDIFMAEILLGFPFKIFFNRHSGFVRYGKHIFLGYIRFGDFELCLL